MSLAIITVVYQNYSVLADFFSSLKHQGDSFHVFVVDVSIDKKDIPSTDVPHTVLHAENKGYAAAVNVGVSRAASEGYDAFVVVNSDIVFSQSFITSVSRSIAQNPKSIIGGKIYYAKGYEYHKDRYTEDQWGKVFWYAGGEIDWDHATVAHTGVDEVDSGQYDKKKETDFITGCLVCYDLAAHKAVGPWDESYFMYYEDVDFSVRAKQAGLAVFYDPSIVIWHKNAQSTDGSGSDFHVTHQKKNRIKFGLRYAPLRTKLHLVKGFLFG